MAMEEDAGETPAIRAAVRSAKKASKPAKIGEPEKRPSRPGSKKKDKKKVAAKRGSAFESDMGQRAAREGVRAKKTDIIGGMGTKKGGKHKSRRK